jgi:hypothetical protein
MVVYAATPATERGVLVFGATGQYTVAKTAQRRKLSPRPFLTYAVRVRVPVD